jgi:NADH:ubiquinone oxidoreductase subunit 5 (subunit L)/multisubunit Na+/H+ antiporter MnhA subunit
MVAAIATLAAIVVLDRVYHIGLFYMAIGVATYVLITFYVLRPLRSPDTPRKAFWIFVKCSLIFFGGAAYGIVLWWRDGRPWIELLMVMWPLAMATFLLRYAFKARRKAVA